MSEKVKNIKVKLEGWDWKKNVKFLKRPIGMIILLLISFLISILCYFDLHLPILFYSNLESADSLLKNRLTEIISIFTSSFALIALIFTLIQVNKKNTDVISIMFSETFIFPYLGFNAGFIIVFITLNSFLNSNLLSNNFIIRLSFLSFYVEVLQIFYLIFIIFRLYKILTTDFFFDNFIENIKNLPIKPNNNISYEKINNELKEKLNEAIIIEDNVKIEKIFNTYISLIENKPNIYFVNMLSNTIYETFKKSVEQNDYNSCYNTINFLIRFLRYGIEQKNYSIINKYNNLPNDFVILSLKNIELKINVIDYLSLRFSEQYDNYLIYEEYNMNDINNVKEFKKLSSLILYPINQTLKILIDNNELELFIIVFNRFNNIYRYIINNRNLYDLDFDIYKLKEEKVDKKIILDKENLLLELKKINQTFILINLGLYTWTLELFIRNEIEANNTKEFLNKIGFAFSNVEELIEILISIQDYHKFEDFGWGDWLLPPKSMLDLKVYSLTHIPSWITLGVVFKLFDISFDNRLKSANFKSLVDSEKSVFIYDVIKSSLDTLSENYNTKFEKILNPSIDDFEESKNLIDEFFKKLKTRYEYNRKIEITNSQINIENIKLLKEDINNQFNDSKNLFSLFEYFNNFELVEKGKVKNKIESYINFQNYKEFLVGNSEGFKFYYNLGNIINSAIDNSTVDFLNNNIKPQLSNQDNIIDKISEAIIKIRANNFSPNVILIDSKIVFSNFAVINKVLDENKKFLLNNKELPYFKDLILIKLDNGYIRNKIIILDFEQSLKLILDKSQEKEILDIKVDYSEEKIKIQNQDDFEFTQTELEKIDKINTVGIKVKKYIDFEILNRDAFIVLGLIPKQS